MFVTNGAKIGAVSKGETQYCKIYKGDTLYWEKEQPYDGNYFIVVNSTNSFTYKVNDATSYTVATTPNVPKMVKVTEALTSCKGMFSNCTSIVSLELHLDTSNVTSMDSMFYNCQKLTSVNARSMSTNKCTSIIYLFKKCASIEILDLVSFWKNANISKYSMFDSCTGLKTLYLSFNPVYGYLGDMFAGCSSLDTLRFGINANNHINLKDSPLTSSSVASVIDGLASVTATKTLTLKSTVFNALTDDKIATIASKGWSVVSA